MSPVKYHLVALFTVFVWGTTFVSTKVLLANLSPLWILLIRFAIGFCALCILRPHILRLKERKHEILFAAAGATGIAAYYLLENVALVFTTATAVGVIVAASPLFTGILSALLGNRSALNWRFFSGFLLAMGGLLIVSTGSGAEDPMVAFGSFSLFGDLLALLAALVWASAACFVTWGASVKHLGPTMSTTYIYLVPAITATASVLILGEPMNLPIVAGVAMTIGGLILSQGRSTDPDDSG